MLDDVADSQAAEPLTCPFAGVPFLVKDLPQEYAGFPTTNGGSEHLLRREEQSGVGAGAEGR
ncbi:MAG: hypothetical protein WB798_12725 [Nocardioidaceae bacterium]